MPEQKKYLRIEPSRGLAYFSFKELWQHIDLFFYLILRDVRASTHSTRLGLLWVLLQPLATALIISMVMGYLVKVPTGETPYPVVVLSGLFVWSYFSNALIRSANSMVANAYLLTKVYFPRIIIPVVPVVSGLVDMLILLLVMIGVCLFYGVYPSSSWFVLLAVVPIIIVLTTGLGLLATALTVRVRDFSNILPVMLQLGLYLSPVLYPSSIVPDKWLHLYNMNPIAQLIECVRGALMGIAPSWSQLLYPAIFAMVCLAIGAIYFRMSEDIATDLV